MTRIDRKFRELKRAKKKAFITFITAGYPNLKITERLLLEFDKIGVDIVELGVPFSDPMADGPVIQESSQQALKRGINLGAIFNSVKSLRRQTNIPICLMSYYNPIFCFGQERFLRQARLCGVDGVIIPDLPPEEDKSFLSQSRRYGLDVICFIAPTTSRQRIQYISKVSGGFIYYVSLTGVTGPRERLPSDLKKNLQIIKANTSKPVCVGFGVSSPIQVKELFKVADGVIVGSAIVKKIKDNLGRIDLVKRVTAFVRYLKNV